jgi:integrase
MHPRIRKTIRIGGKRVSQYFRTKKAADAWYRKMVDERDAARAGVDALPEETLVIDFAKKFIAMRVKKYDHNTFINDEQRMRTYVLPKFGSRVLSKISAAEWETHFDEIVTSQGKSRATSNRVRALVSKMYAEAMRAKPPLAQDNPIRRVKPFDERKTRVKKIKNNLFKTTSQIEQYLDAARVEEPGYWIRLMVIFNTGIRQGESIALKWKDIDWDNQSIKVERTYQQSDYTVKEGTKGFDEGEDYEVGINDALLEALQWWRGVTRFNGPEDYICCQANGKIYHVWHLRRFHRRVLKRARLPFITQHGLRHTYATHYLEQGGRIEDLQRQLGHKNITTTQIYTHALKHTAKKRAQVLSIGDTRVKPDFIKAVTKVSPKFKKTGGREETKNPVIRENHGVKFGVTDGT